MEENVHREDEYFKKAYERSEAEPSPEVWKKISAGLDNVDAVYYRSKFVTWKRIACLLLLLIGTTVLYQIYKTEEESFTPPVTSKTEHPAASASDATARLKLSSQDRAGSHDRINSKQPAEGNNLALQQQGKPLTVTRSSAGAKPDREDENHFTGNANQRQPSPAQIISGINGNNTLSKYQAKYGAYHTKSNKVRQSRGHVSLQEHQLQPHTFFDSSDSFFTQKINTNQATPEALFEDLPKASARRNDRNDLPAEDSNRIRLISGDHSGNKDNSPNKKNLVLAPRRKNRNQKAFTRYWTVTPFVSADLTGYHLDDDLRENLNQSNDPKLDIEKRETHQFSFSAGALAKWQLSPKLSAKTGLIYSDVAIGIHPQTLHATLDNNSQNVSFKLITSSGYAYVKPVFGPAPAPGDSITSNAAQHNLQYLSVPLMIGYKLNAGKRLSITPGVGVSANVLLGTVVRTEIHENTGKEAVVINKLQGLRKTYFSFMADAEVNYSISNRISLSLLPVLKYAVSPITKNNVVKTYPYSFSIGAGITYHFK